ncbi:sugar transferase [Seohaeicola saemankumensis]|uniref:sugar transferase n=1 Tax=Seohaeicola TaxID=481178 RepID=UPI0035CF0D94|nr:sugar transferase [Paracoccaceae bacterium]
MNPAKRGFDLLVAGLLALVLWPVALAIALVILLVDGRPVFHVSERMKTPDISFHLWKFRTMRPVAGDVGVSGGDKSDRITRMGHILRRTRLDEIPQLVNIMRGDISLVGPRPPLRRYVELFPSLYAEVLKQRPGLTGLATLVYHRTEERLLKNCATPQETEEVYTRRCVPRKARLDLIYAEKRGICLDFRLILATAFRFFLP